MAVLRVIAGSHQLLAGCASSFAVLRVQVVGAIARGVEWLWIEVLSSWLCVYWSLIGREQSRVCALSWVSRRLVVHLVTLLMRGKVPGGFLGLCDVVVLWASVEWHRCVCQSEFSRSGYSSWWVPLVFGCDGLGAWAV